MICGYRDCGLIIGMVGLQLLLSPFSVASRYVGASKVSQVVLGSITSRCGPERVAEIEPAVMFLARFVSLEASV